MTKKRALYIGDSSDDETLLTYSISDFCKKITTVKSEKLNFVSSFILEEISHSILYDQNVVKNYINKKNKLKEKLATEDFPDVNHFFLGKYLNKKLNDEDLINFYKSNQKIIQLIHKELSTYVKPFNTEYQKLAPIVGHDYDPLHKFLKARLGVDLKAKLVNYCNKPRTKKDLGLNKTYSDSEYDDLINALKENSATKGTEKKLHDYCISVFQEELATIKPNTKAGRKFLSDLGVGGSAQLELYSKHINDISGILQNSNTPQNSVESDIQKLSIKIYIEQLNIKNTLLSNDLEQLRPNKLYLEDENREIESLSDFKLAHKIARNTAKSQGIADQKKYIGHDVGLRTHKSNLSLLEHKFHVASSISVNGARSDLIKFLGGKGSYKDIAEQLEDGDFSGKTIFNVMTELLKNGQTNEDLTDSQIQYLTELTYLLFRCEPERNASAFITNVMFLELLRNDTYRIDDIPNKMPMAMKGAVAGARYLLDKLGGEYGESSTFLAARKHYDFGNVDETDGEILAIRDTLILYRWLQMKLSLQIDKDIDTVVDKLELNIKYIDTLKENASNSQGKKANSTAALNQAITQQLNKIQADAEIINKYIAQLFGSQSKEGGEGDDVKMVSDAEEDKPIEHKAKEIFKAFHNLVYEWYGIRLDWLYSKNEFKEDNKANFLNEQNIKLIELINKISNITKLNALRFISKEDIYSVMAAENEEIIGFSKKEGSDSWSPILPTKWDKSLKESVLQLMKTMALIPGDTISLHNTTSLLDLIQMKFEKSKYLKEQFEKWTDELWNSKITSSSNHEKLNTETSGTVNLYKYCKANYKDFLIELHKKELNPIKQELDKYLKDNCSAENYKVSLFYKDSSTLAEAPNYAEEPKTFFLEIRIDNIDSNSYSLKLHFPKGFSEDKEPLVTAVQGDLQLQALEEEVYKAEGKKIINIEVIKAEFQKVEAFLAKVSQEYVNKMEKYEGNEVLWGGDIELDILAQIYKLYITVHHKNEKYKKFVGDSTHQKKIHLYLEGNHYQYFKDEPSYKNEVIDESGLQNVAGDGNCLFYAVNNAAKLSQSVQDLRTSVYDSLEQLLADIKNKKEVEREGTEKTDYKPITVQLNDNDNPILSRFKAIFEANSKEAFNNAINDLPNSTIIAEATEIHKNLINQLYTLPSDLLQGINEYTDGLTIESINLNLKNIIKFSNQSDLYIEPEVIAKQQVTDKFLNWLVNQNTFNHYASIVKVENILGKKHAILLHAMQGNDSIHITLIDPLSEEASTFKLEIGNLALSLHQEGITLEVIYVGRQDKDYGTCADISLIMLQELIEQTADKSILNPVHQKFIESNLITSNSAIYENDMFHNFDYENYHPALLGQDQNETI